MFEIGNHKMNTKLEAYSNVKKKSDGAPDWSLSWTLQFYSQDKKRGNINYWL